MSDESLINDDRYEINETQQSTLDAAEKSSLGGLIRDISDELSLETFEKQSDIPIPVEMIPYGEKELSIDSEVNKTLDLLVETANDPRQPLEVPFALFGNSAKLSNAQMLFSDVRSLNSISVAIESAKLGSVYQKVLESDNLNTLTIAHTHPKVSESLQKTVLTSKIPQRLKNKYGIKEVGLNLSLQDLYQLESLYEQIGDKVHVLLGILFYDGNLVLVERAEEGFRRVRHSEI